MFGKKKRVSEDPVVNLARGIAYCDDLRAYRRKDLDQIDETFEALKKTRFREYNEMWTRARPAADKIVNMPLKVGGVKRMIGALSWIRVAGRVGLIVVVLMVAMQFVPAWRRALGSDPFGGNGLLYTIITVLFAVALLNLGSIMDYLIRKRIIAYEDSTMDEYAPYRDRMKDCVDKMMRSLAREIERGTETPDSLSMVLYFDDYQNIKVINHWRPKSMWVFKKSYNHYQIVPKS